MGMSNVSCPRACVTFENYGRLNNMVIQLANAVAAFVNPSTAASPASRRSILLHDSFRASFGTHSDYAQLRRTCIFASWPPARGGRARECTPVPARAMYTGQPLPRALTPREEGLGRAWLMLGAVRADFRRQNAAELAALGGDFSVVHVRSLEGSCAERHQRQARASSICRHAPAFVLQTLRSVGHESQAVVVCTDHQQPAQVALLVARLNATVSPHRDPMRDVMTMLRCKRFVGNSASTFSLNVASVRAAVFGDALSVTV